MHHNLNHDLTFELMILTRVLSACLLGFAIGLERELTNKYAGLRTHILVCLGSCVFTVLSLYAFPAAVAGSHGDPARISAQILTGIGFIGGGTVLRHGSSVYGLTTAATLWVAASIGMACGTGLYDIAIFATLFSVLILVLIRIFEQDVLVNSTKNLKRLRVVVLCQDENADEIHDYIVESFNHMHEISRKRSEKKENQTKIVAIIDVNNKKPIQSMYKMFKELAGLESISIQDNNE